MKRSTKHDGHDPCVEDHVTCEMDDALEANRAEEAQRFTADDARRANQRKPERETCGPVVPAHQSIRIDASGGRLNLN
jgi:hypothetical protein